MMKRSNLIGSLSNPNFATRTAKMDLPRINIVKFLYSETLNKRKLFYNIKLKHFSFMSGGQFRVNFYESGQKESKRCIIIIQTIIELTCPIRIGGYWSHSVLICKFKVVAKRLHSKPDHYFPNTDRTSWFNNIYI